MPCDLPWWTTDIEQDGPYRMKQFRLTERNAARFVDVNQGSGTRGNSTGRPRSTGASRRTESRKVAIRTMEEEEEARQYLRTSWTSGMTPSLRNGRMPGLFILLFGLRNWN